MLWHYFGFGELQGQGPGVSRASMQGLQQSVEMSQSPKTPNTPHPKTQNGKTLGNPITFSPAATKAASHQSKKTKDQKPIFTTAKAGR